MNNRSETSLEIAKHIYIAASIMYFLLGLVFALFPRTSASAIIRVAGVIMIIFGIVKLIGYFSKDLYRLAFRYDLEFGIVLLILGIAVLAKPEGALTFLCIALGITVLADGIVKVRIAIDSKVFGISKWWMIMGFAAVAVIAGLMLIFRPHESANALMDVLGITLMADGVLNLCVVLTAVKFSKQEKRAVIESEDFKIDE